MFYCGYWVSIGCVFGMVLLSVLWRELDVFIGSGFVECCMAGIGRVLDACIW